MKVLLVTHFDINGDETEYGGVQYYRMTKPNAVLRRIYPEYELKVAMMEEFNLRNEEANAKMHKDERIAKLKGWITENDLIIFNREVYPEAIELFKELGRGYILDIDDYWKLPGHHMLYDHYKTNNIEEVTVNSIRNAEAVICTTPILAEKIKPYNENVHVIENGIDSEDPVWQLNKSENKRMRFGFTQGSTHFHDLKTVHSSVRRAMEETWFRLSGQIVHCGFSLPKEGAQNYDWSKVDMYQHTELEFTDSHRLVGNKNHILALRSYEPYNDTNEIYRRVYSKKVLEFPTIYDDIDVSVAPLKPGIFNSCKSELKMLEAGFKGCAIMVNYNPPYTLLANEKNSFDLNKKTFREWAKILISNPNMVEDSKAQLRQDVEKYDLKHLSVKRHQLYQKYGRNNSNGSERTGDLSHTTNSEVSSIP